MARMRRRRGRAAAAAVGLMIFGGSASAQIALSHPWARLGPPGAPVEAFVSIENQGAAADRLIGVRVDGAAAARIVRARFDGDGYEATPLDGVATPTDAVVALAPRGAYIRIDGLERRLHLGAELPITLTFAGAGDIEALFIVGDGPSAGLGVRAVFTPTTPVGHEDMDGPSSAAPGL